MRLILADLEGSEGFVDKDTIAGGYGFRLQPFSTTTRVFGPLRRRGRYMPSVQMGYLAAILARDGHDIKCSSGEALDGDVAIVLSSLVDYRHETCWADMMRSRGVKVGFIGLAASVLPWLFVDHADFVIRGEPESAILRLSRGETLQGICESPPETDLDGLPFPRWDLICPDLARSTPRSLWGIGKRRTLPVLASRGCTEFCTYCPHRILAPHRKRSVPNIVDELEYLCERHPSADIAFRDPLFTEDRERCLAMCDEIQARGLKIHFDCETRFDRLDAELLDRLRAAGLKVLSLGVESVSPETLRRVGRRPTPQSHQRAVVSHSWKLGILTVGLFMIGFPVDDWQSVAATIQYATELGTTFALFKLVTPYPGTPMWSQLEDSVYERDWERFDGCTPTFEHANLSAHELHFLLGAAFARFYARPSWLADYWGLRQPVLRGWIDRLDAWAMSAHSRKEIRLMSRAVSC